MLRKKYRIVIFNRYKFVNVGWSNGKYEKCKYCKNSCLVIFDGNRGCHSINSDIVRECIEIKHNLVPLKYFNWDNSKDVKYKKL